MAKTLAKTLRKNSIPWSVLSTEGPFIRLCPICGKALRVSGAKLSFGTVLSVTWDECEGPHAE